jgi:hypothetical protein
MILRGRLKIAKTPPQGVFGNKRLPQCGFLMNYATFVLKFKKLGIARRKLPVGPAVPGGLTYPLAGFHRVGTLKGSRVQVLFSRDSVGF